MSNHVTSKFLDWSEGKLSREAQSAIESHLLKCPKCKAYFEQMSDMLDVVDRSALPTLAADPYLPTRIAALAREKQALSRHKLLNPARQLRVAFSTLMLVGAMGIGIFLGKDLATTTQTSQSEQLSDYTTIIWDNGIVENMDAVIEYTLEDGK